MWKKAREEKDGVYFFVSVLFGTTKKKAEECMAHNSLGTASKHSRFLFSSLSMIHLHI
jgi:hypothetical protein